MANIGASVQAAGGSSLEQTCCNKTSGWWVSLVRKEFLLRKVGPENGKSMGQAGVMKKNIRTSTEAFTLLELLVVIAIISILASLLLPSLVRAKQRANQIKCVNHLKQLELALTMYADENEGQFPARRKSPLHWVFKLEPYYLNAEILQCPSDRFFTRRSYIINGWNDYFEATLSAADYGTFTNWNWPEGMREEAIPNPSETITFGEKATDSGHVHMDFYQINDLRELEHARHNGRSSNYAFADGSVRALPYAG
jgi:prepilin-type processing-associated H-X9-DG protein/prepilin-type N-terminal cleavage/methylation domain-containing protein